jgi:hypothetical protein
MQRTAALWRIEKEMRFDVGPKSNPIPALVNLMRAFPSNDSRGVEAAAAASTNAGRTNTAEEGPSKGRCVADNRKLRKENSSRAESPDQLKFGCMKIKD